MPRHLLWLALGIGLGLSACATSPRPPQAPRVLPVTLPDTSTACAEWRWIGIASPTAKECPSVPGWKVSPLFPPSSQAQEVHDQLPRPYDRQLNFEGKQDPEKLAVDEASQELNRFCLYEIEDPKKNLGDVPFPPAVSADLVRFDQDCAAISPAGDRDLSRATWKDVSAYFLSQAGRTPLTINNRRGVRLSFLDTQPTSREIPREPGNSMHGYTLAHIARHLVCSSETGDCAAQITTQLTLRYMQFDARSQALTRTDARGGHFGLQSDLAKAIESEVASWQAEDPRQHLVLNLSVGWDAQLFGGLDQAQRAEMRAGTQAIYSALRYAKSLDVLVLAAAGNRTQCSTEGPLLPAAWERGAASVARCCNAPEAPLVYAVGGVQSDGQPLANARDRGLPRRVAYGENAVVPSGATERRRTYTGSSAATAVVSSIAAVVWDSFPNLSSDEVMEILDASGDALKVLEESGDERPRLADFWFSACSTPTLKAPEVHRLSLCTALKAACDGRRTEPCPLQVDTCEPWIAERTIFPKWCSGPLVSGTCSAWLLPQPGDPPCPNPECPPYTR